MGKIDLKYYVYTSKSIIQNERDCIYVAESVIDVFALKEFDPSVMEYSGVVVEANDPSEAHTTYNTFSGGEIIWTDEPESTVIKRLSFDKTKDVFKSKLKDLKEALAKTEIAATRLAIQSLGKSISLNIVKINKDISTVSRLISKMTNDNPGLSSKDLYQKIKDKYIEELKRCRYTD